MSRMCVRPRWAAFGIAALALFAGEAALRPGLAAGSNLSKDGSVEIAGQYSISFNGFHIGDARIDQRVTGRTYTASSDIEISALLGAFRWKGVTRASGTLAGEKIVPSGYDFQFESSSKSGSVRIGFEKGAVSELMAIPLTAEPEDFVPLAPTHVKSVIDPLSAIVAVSRPSAEPCGRKFAVFDGKQRFDLALLPTRREAVPAGRNGATVEGVVCRVKYTPVAGYRNNAETRALVENGGIEVTFRPVSEARLWTPYRVTVPTIAGYVSLEATRYDISAPGQDEIALVD